MELEKGYFMWKETLRPVWVEINLAHLDYNIKQIQKKIGEAEIIGVVKADAYGHGAVEVSKVLLENGVKTLAVATLPEAIVLRENGITCQIVMLGITPELYLDTLIKEDITPVTSSLENARACSAAAAEQNRQIELYLAIDTGMGRIGFLPNEESVADIKRIAELTNIKIKGFFSHLSTADESEKIFSNQQIEKYETFYQRLLEEGIHVPVRTLGNSAAIMEVPGAHFDAVRPGIILYGGYPSEAVDKSQLSIKPVMSVKANIVHLKKVPSGFSISYGRTFITEKESIIATLPLGYADGYPRFLSGKGRVIIRGQYAPVVGIICMDQCMVDVTNIPGVALGDEVIIMGVDGDLEVSAHEIAKKTGTINYEVVCAFGQRLPKRYL